MEVVIILVTILGMLLRVVPILKGNVILGFDQFRDLATARQIIEQFDIKFVGPTAGNNPFLHHGVAFWYYIVPPLLVSKDPTYVALWNAAINMFAVLVLYGFAKSLWKEKTTAVFVALIAAISYEWIEYARWLSNPTVTILTIPMVFWGLWIYHKGKAWGIYLAALSLGLSIQFELFLIYLVPIVGLSMLLLKIKIPTKKQIAVCIGIGILTTGTIIGTQLKDGSEGIKAFLTAGEKVGGNVEKTKQVEEFSRRFANSMALSIWPQDKEGGAITILVGAGLIRQLVKNRKNKNERDAIILLTIYLLSPAIMLLLGYHNAPWFLIGRIGATALAAGFVISRIEPKYIGVAVLVAIVVNSVVYNKTHEDASLLEPDQSAILKYQKAAMKYTYESSNGLPFAINSLTNPLYINYVWSYNYSWYGKQYGYMPTFSGGNQKEPFNALSASNGTETYLYLLMDTSPRIPSTYKMEVTNWANQKSSLLEEKDFGGILVQRRLWN
jgi:hypothetical protein